MTYSLWDVVGKFIIPGTRKTASFGPVRIGDHDRQSAAKHLAKLLNDQFSRDLRGVNRFSDHFALYNMQWKIFAPKTGVVAP
jgi:hypothetical protein